jgi:hypothetical protein
MASTFDDDDDAANSKASCAFLEIFLVDEQNRPRAGQRFRVIDCEGTVQEGCLDGNGRARIDDLPATPNRVIIGEDRPRRLQGMADATSAWTVTIELGFTTAPAQRSVVIWMGREAGAVDICLAAADSRSAIENLRALQLRAVIGRVPLQEIEVWVRETAVAEALARSRGSIRGAARLLGMSRQRLQHILHGKRPGVPGETRVGQEGLQFPARAGGPHDHGPQGAVYKP